MGGWFYLCQHLAGIRVCSIHHRRFRRCHRRQAGGTVDGDGVCTGCTGAGSVVPSFHRSHAKGLQYVSLAYTQRLQEPELLALTGSTGDFYENASASTACSKRRWYTPAVQEKSLRGCTGYADVGGLVQKSSVAWVTWAYNSCSSRKAYYTSIGEGALAAWVPGINSLSQSRGCWLVKRLHISCLSPCFHLC